LLKWTKPIKNYPDTAYPIFRVNRTFGGAKKLILWHTVAKKRTITNMTIKKVPYLLKISS